MSMTCVRRMLPLAICMALPVFALSGADVATVEVVNLTTTLATLPDGRKIGPGDNATVEVESGLQGMILGMEYPALPAGGHAVLILGSDREATTLPAQTSRKTDVSFGETQVEPTPARPSAGALRQIAPAPASQVPGAPRMTGQGRQAPVATRPEGTTARILSKIDADGIYLKVINAEQFEEEALARIRALCLIGYRLAYEDDHEAARAFAARVGKVVKGTGIFSIQGCGESIASGDGPWWKTKQFLLRTPLAGTDFSIKAPTQYLPDTSYIACASTFNISGFNALVEGTIERQEPALYSEIQKMRDELSAQAQMGDLGALFTSFAPGFVFAVASENTMVVPSDYGRGVEVPGVLLGFRMERDDAVVALRSFISRSCVQSGANVQFESRGNGDLANVVFFDFSQQEAIEALGLPLPLSIAHDRQGKMLLFSTSRGLLRHSVLASRGKADSLEGSAIYKAHAAGLPGEGGLFWFSPEFVPKLIKEILSSGLVGVESEAKAKEAVDVISLFLPKFWTVSRSVQQRDGVMTIANRPSIESTSVMLIDHFCGVSLVSLAETIWKILPEDSFADFVMMLFGAWKDEEPPLEFDQLRSFGENIFN